MLPPGFPEPVSIYINWASYDLLSDNVPLTEQLALEQLEHLVRLQRQDVRFDYYLMDAFWFDPDGGYRTWDRRYWSPAGPKRWIERCQAAGVQPGIWVGCNSLATPIFQHLNAIDRWRDSLDPTGRSACFFHGGFLADFMEALQHWVDQGVRLFKFDFADLAAAPLEVQRVCLPSEIRRRNSDAFALALQLFREKNPEVRLLAYNGLIEHPGHAPMAGTGLPVRRSIDTRWLDVFDAVYCGDPRPADIPCSNFWRSKDIYSDHMVRYFEANGYPLSRIDNSGFMIGTTGTCYGRRKQAWRGMLVLSLARGGWANTYYGNLDLLTDEDARWFARVQELYFALQRTAIMRAFGGLPGTGQPYGFWAHAPEGDLCTVVNPSSEGARIELPVASGRVLFADDGFEPTLDGAMVTLGPEQLAVFGRGVYEEEKYTFGREPDVVIPRAVERVSAEFQAEGEQRISARFPAPEKRGQRWRVLLRQTRDGMPLRSSGGPPPDGITLGRMLQVRASQGGRTLSPKIGYDLAIWSGLSWAVAEFADAEPGQGLVDVMCSTTEKPPVQLAAEIQLLS